DHAKHDGGQPTARLHGWLGADRVTLDRAFCAGNNWRSPGIAETSYYANRMFVGQHIQEDEPSFQTARVTLGHLDSWIGKTGIAEDRRFPRPPDTEAAYAMRFTPLPSETTSFARGRVTVGFSWKPGGNSIEGITFKQWPVVSIEYDTLQPLHVISDDISRLVSLVTLCLDELTSTDTVKLSRPDVRMRMLDGSISELEQPIELLFPPVGYVDPITRKRRQPYQMLLTYEELGGIEAIARWLDRSESFARPLNLIMSIRRAKFMFAENRFLNVAGAAEALHRLIMGGPHMDEAEFQKLFDAYLTGTPAEHHEWLRSKIEYGNEPPLRKRMQQLAGMAAPATRPLIGDKSRWGYTVAAVRNELTHLGRNSRQFDGEDLLFLTESVYAVARVCMLLATGVPVDAIASKAESEPMSWYRSRLKRSIERIRTQLRSPRKEAAPADDDRAAPAVE
ncbi:MAG: hypothetical protein JW990_12565, partial [Thermoleophilia bacterium]|nr:hypothetical protein [Thermoleophilia bacterium]